MLQKSFCAVGIRFWSAYEIWSGLGRGEKRRFDDARAGGSAAVATPVELNPALPPWSRAEPVLPRGLP